ncbi:ion transporter [Candidatus Nitrospira neomarina]|uniref:Ion transporter n=1 Tax=Candidatus Nitrospira neomarina TaxID=3020899 RepID=A0AA96GKE4_9BACT|nr:ion transporter [Candidatus Nitrospira neomarina]WNM60633.1 ion transporter [Candidatus Nitrospira neomarina]
MKDQANQIVRAPWFEYGIIAFILINGVILGLETSPALVEHYGVLMHWGNHVILGIFILEALIKMIAVAPQIDRYFRDGWNLFDFSVIVFSLIPATGEFAMIARLARLLRVVRLISTIPELRLIVSTLVRSIPSMIHVMTLMGVIFYVYAIMGYQLFHEHDPTHWRSLGISLLTLFRVVTLEDWTDVMYTAMDFHYLSWMCFVSFVVLGTFVVINLFIAVVINNLDEAKAERLAELQGPVTQKEILNDLRETQIALKRLEERLERMSGENVLPLSKV